MKDTSISRLRVLFTIWILIYHSWNEYILGTPNIHQIEDLEILRGITNLVLEGFVFISGFLVATGYFNLGKYEDKAKFIKGKIRRILLPYLGWALLGTLIYSTPPSKY